MSERLRGVLMMSPTVAEMLFPPDIRARLDDAFEIVPDLAEAEVIISGWGTPGVDEVVLDAAPKLRAIIHAAGSVKEGRIKPVVWERGVLVTSAAEVNARPVAQYTLAVILLAGKRAFGLAASYRNGQYRSYTSTKDTGNVGRTVGVVGASRIGRLVLSYLAPHGFRLLVADPYLTADQARACGAELVELDELISHSDVVTLHAPLLPQTRHLIDDRRLGLMRDGAILVNTGRGGLIEADALVAHCSAGRIDAVLDVSDPEPLPKGHPLLAMPNVFITPHIAGALGREVGELGRFAVDELSRLRDSRPLLGQVESSDLDRIA